MYTAVELMNVVAAHLLRAPALLYLPPKRASLSQTCQASSWLAKHDIAVSTENNGLCMAVDGCDLQATWALHVHEETIRRLNNALQLVLALLVLGTWVQEINIHGWNTSY